MYNYTGRIVRSTAGHDKGQLFCVAGVDQTDCRLLLAGGKRRRLERPKRKKLGHVKVLTPGEEPFDHPVIRRLQQGQPVSDRELRRALAAFKEGNTFGER